VGEVETRTSVKGGRQSETARHLSLSFNVDTMNQSCRLKKLPRFKQGASEGQSTGKCLALNRAFIRPGCSEQTPQ
jgi:hypothetical protein